MALHVSGAVRLKTVVSQGCRPIGRPFVVTKAERNVIHELGGKPALVQLREIFDTLPTSEQRLVQRALHVGRVPAARRGGELQRPCQPVPPERELPHAPRRAQDQGQAQPWRAWIRCAPVQRPAVQRGLELRRLDIPADGDVREIRVGLVPTRLHIVPWL